MRSKNLRAVSIIERLKALHQITVLVNREIKDVSEKDGVEEFSEVYSYIIT
jgi:hypothetical protein